MAVATVNMPGRQRCLECCVQHRPPHYERDLEKRKEFRKKQQKRLGKGRRFMRKDLREVTDWPKDDWVRDVRHGSSL